MKENDQGTDFCDELDIGDIVAVKNGTLPIALVEVIGKKEISSAPNEDLDWFPLPRKIESSISIKKITIFLFRSLGGHFQNVLILIQKHPRL